MRGRKPKPTHLHLIQGSGGRTARGRSINKLEPKPPHGNPAPPSHLKGEALAAWHLFAPLMIQSGLLSKLDAPVFGALVHEYAGLVRTTRELAVTGPFIETRTGILKQHPLVAVNSGHYKKWISLAIEFGMTPSSRSRVAAAGDPPEDELQIPGSRTMRAPLAMDAKANSCRSTFGSCASALKLG